MKKNNQKISDEWIQKANNDWEAARLLFEESGPSDTICFHCHQAVEKYLKAWLSKQGARFPLTHELANLVLISKRKDADFENLLDDAERLNAYYIPSRYPADAPVDYTQKEIKEVLEMTEWMTDKIKEKL